MPEYNVQLGGGGAGGGGDAFFTFLFEKRAEGGAYLKAVSE